MHKDDRSKKHNRALSILLGYNAPLILWTLSALFQVWTGHGLLGACPVRALLHWCPGCGLTRSYVALLTERRIADIKFLIVWGALVLNLLWSIRLAALPSKNGKMEDLKTG